LTFSREAAKLNVNHHRDSVNPSIAQEIFMYVEGDQPIGLSVRAGMKRRHATHLAGKPS
jgi:hypothetical protein